MATLQSRPMMVFNLLTGGVILIFANGRVMKIPPNPPPNLREIKRAADILARADSIRLSAAQVKKLGRSVSASITSKLAEIQELVQQQVATQEKTGKGNLIDAELLEGERLEQTQATRVFTAR